jgi:hypothetical protein
MGSPANLKDLRGFPKPLRSTQRLIGLDNTDMMLFIFGKDSLVNNFTLFEKPSSYANPVLFMLPSSDCVNCAWGNPKTLS